MSKQNFTMGFDGAALKDHQIDAVDLAVALTGMSELLDFSNKILNGGDVKLKLQVKATKEGSFNILLELSQTLSGLFHGVTVKNILEWIGLIEGDIETIGSIGGGITTLICLYRWLKSKQIKRQEEKDGMVILYAEDETYIEVKKEIATLMSVKEVRKSIAVMLSPLSKDGIDSFYTSTDFNKSKRQVITKDEIDTFAYTETKQEEQLFNVAENTMVCKIIGIMFEEGLKWKLANSEGKFMANVIDPVFLHKINIRELQFSKGDLLKARVEVKTFTLNGNLRNEYSVIEVLAIIPPPQNISLFE